LIVSELKKCKDCKKSFEKKAFSQDRCYDCQRIRNNKKHKEYLERLKNKVIICAFCDREFVTASVFNRKYCSISCFRKHTKILRLGKGNPAYRNGLRCKSIKRNRYGERGLTKVRTRIIKKMLKEKGYIYCEYCNTSNSLRWEMHHIIYRSEAPKHKNLHHRKNGILLCIKCHNILHKDKSLRDSLIEERKLYLLFPEYIKNATKTE